MDDSIHLNPIQTQFRMSDSKREQPMSEKNAGFPWYFAIDDRPVKVVATADGGMDVLIFNAATNRLERDMAYLARCFEPGQAVQRLSEAEFNDRLTALQQGQAEG